jgi:hypothetical protein
MYWATSFWDRENSSNRARMYDERVWWPAASIGAAGESAAVRFMGRHQFDGPRERSSPVLDSNTGLCSGIR